MSAAADKEEGGSPKGAGWHGITHAKPHGRPIVKVCEVIVYLFLCKLCICRSIFKTTHHKENPIFVSFLNHNITNVNFILQGNQSGTAPMGYATSQQDYQQHYLNQQQQVSIAPMI